MKQLILTADDFGRSPEINAAIERAHRAGFLTQASLMVNEPAAEEAVQIARRNPELCVGLHLTLCAGQATRISAITDCTANFRASPAGAGLRYFFDRALTIPLRDEIRGQFERFRALGFAAAYWDGHAHLHLHPSILALTVPVAAEYGFRATRLVREPGPPAVLPWIFKALSSAAIPLVKKHDIHFADHVFGLRQTGRMTTAAMAHVLQTLPVGLSELYFHPGAEAAEIDYSALVPLLAREGITPRTSLPPSAAR